MSEELNVSFADLGLAEPLLRAVAGQNYTIPTPIQAQAIPPIISGYDLLGCAQTGTGKTAAFALPILHRLTAAGNPLRGNGRRSRVLVLSPTRELALQISESFEQYAKGTALRQTVIFGGVSQNRQTHALQKGVDIIIATPGRLLDLMNQGYVDLKHVQVLVLDEADRMLDMGFMPDIRRIMKSVPQERQTLLFSATMPPHIKELADTILRDPVQVRIAPAKATTELIEQAVYFVPQQNKVQLLVHFASTRREDRTIVFTRTKHGADAVVQKLARAGFTAESIHGNKSQNARQRALDNFKQNKTRILVATDIAARGIDVDGISFVVNFDLPREAETYVHRIGRTGRAGATGMAVSFCDPGERRMLKAIEREIRKPIAVANDHPAYSQAVQIKTGGNDNSSGSNSSGGQGYGRKSGQGYGGSKPGGNKGGRPQANSRFAGKRKDRLTGPGSGSTGGKSTSQVSAAIEGQAASASSATTGNSTTSSKPKFPRSGSGKPARRTTARVNSNGQKKRPAFRTARAKKDSEPAGSAS
jgi:ATP-dependent RNA helicase RhlE